MTKLGTVLRSGYAVRGELKDITITITCFYTSFFTDTSHLIHRVPRTA